GLQRQQFVVVQLRIEEKINRGDAEALRAGSTLQIRKFVPSLGRNYAISDLQLLCSASLRLRGENLPSSNQTRYRNRHLTCVSDFETKFRRARLILRSCGFRS